MTFANSIRQTSTILVGVIGLALITLSAFFGMFNFSDADRLRMLFTIGVAISTLSGLFLSVVLTSTAIHDELASRTALTLFAKPMSRASFLVEKALGITVAIGVVHLVLLAAHITMLLLFERFQHHHSEWWIPWSRIVGGHLLAWIGSAVLVSVTTVCALRLSLVSNMVIAFAVFVLSHLLASSGVDGFVLLPAMGLLNIDDSLHFAALTISPSYIILCALYGLLYSAGVLILGLALFQEQDIP